MEKKLKQFLCVTSRYCSLLFPALFEKFVTNNLTFIRYLLVFMNQGKGFTHMSENHHSYSKRYYLIPVQSNYLHV